MKFLSLLAALTASATTVTASRFGGYAAAFAAITPGSKIPAIDLDSVSFLLLLLLLLLLTSNLRKRCVSSSFFL